MLLPDLLLSFHGSPDAKPEDVAGMWEHSQPGSGRDEPTILSQGSQPCCALLLCEDPQSGVPPLQLATLQQPMVALQPATELQLQQELEGTGQKRKGELGKGKRFFFSEVLLLFFFWEHWGLSYVQE